MTRHIPIQDRSQTYKVNGCFGGKMVSYTVTAFNVREALQKAIIENVYDAREKLGNSEILWEVEEDFL